MIFFILLMLIPYLVVGARYSRNRYATILHNQRQALVNPVYQEELKQQRAALTDRHDNTGYRHDATCKAHSWSSATYRMEYCNCGVKVKVRNLDAKIVGSPSIPTTFLPFVAWPIYGLDSYLKSGTVQTKTYSPYVTSELEKELGIGELR